MRVTLWTVFGTSTAFRFFVGGPGHKQTRSCPSCRLDGMEYAFANHQLMFLRTIGDKLRGETDSEWKHFRIRSDVMLHWALVFLVVALVAGLFGFTGIYVAAAGIAKVLFFVFLILFLVSLLSGGISRRGPI